MEHCRTPLDDLGHGSGHWSITSGGQVDLDAGIGEAPGEDTHHGLHDDFDVVGREFQILGRGAWRLSARTGAGVDGGQHQTRRVLDAQVGQRGGSLGQLQHGKAVIALANAQGDGLAGIPFLVFGLAVVAPLPFLAGQDTTHFSLHVDSGTLPKAKGLHKVVRTTIMTTNKDAVKELPAKC